MDSISIENCPFYVRYIGNQDTLAFDKRKTYEVLSIERGWYRVMTDLGEDYLFPPSAFKIVENRMAHENINSKAKLSTQLHHPF